MIILRKSALGQDCMIQLPGICNRNPETVVLCHLGGAGMALKSPDYHAAFGCSSCHDVIDGRVKSDYNREELIYIMMHAILRTQDYWFKIGYLVEVKPVAKKIKIF